MTADTPTPTPPDPDPRDPQDGAAHAPDPADDPTARHDAADPADDPTAQRDAPEPADDPTARHDAADDAPTARHDAPAPDPVTPPAEPPPAGLYRSRHDRMLAGVCGGIAERYGIDAVIVRLAFLATLLIGGAGVLFYIAAAIVIPNPPAGPGGASAPIGAESGSTTVGNGILRILIVMAVGLGVLCGLLTIACVTFVGTMFLGPWPAAITLIVLGALLAAVGRSRRSAPALLSLIVAIAIPAAVAVIADLSVDRSVGERRATPLTAAEASEGFRLGIGEMTVDLRQLPLRSGSTPLTVPVRVDIGRAAIVIPDDRCAAWTIRTRLGFHGDVRVLDHPRQDSWAGYGPERTFRVNPGGGPRRPQVTVDAHVGVGEIVVGTSIADVERGWTAGDGAASSTIRTAACDGPGARRR